MTKLFALFTIEVPKPTNYGWFHLLCMAIIITATVLLCIHFKDANDMVFRRIALICWLIMVVFEFYKQIVFTFSVEENVFIKDYDWSAFPYQLCSTPLYILPFVAFIKNQKINDFFASYISTFALFGGIVVFFYPNDVFNHPYLGIHIQTMVHHGLQVVTGVFFAVHNRKRLNFTYFLKAIPVFLVLLSIACILNESVLTALQNSGIEDSFNMFYISRYFENHLPLLSTVYQSVDWIIFLLVYTFGFIVASFIVYSIIIGIIKLVNKLLLTSSEKQDKHA